MIDYVTQDPIIDNINEWLDEKYCLKYTKNFKLYKEEFDDNDGFDYGIGIEQGNFEVPIIIGGQFDNDDEFLVYFKKEFAAKQLWRIPLFQLQNPQVDELDADLYYINEKGERCETELVDNRQIRQVQNEHI